MKTIFMALLLALTATAARAETFAFSYAGAGVSGNGTLTAIPLAPGEYAVTGGTDTATGGGVSGALTLLVNPSTPNEIYSPSGYFIFDDLLLPNGDPVVTNGGLLFTNGAGGEVNIFSYGPDNYVDYDNTGFNVPITIDPSAVPEPATLAVTATGLIGLLYARRRRRAVAGTPEAQHA